MPGRLQAEGFSECPIVKISHNHQATPEADRNISYTKANPAAELKIYAEGGPRKQWDIWARFGKWYFWDGSEAVGSFNYLPFLENALVKVGLDEYWDYGGGNFSRVDSDNSIADGYNETLVQVFFVYPQFGNYETFGARFVSASNPARGDAPPVLSIEIFDRNGNRAYPVATAIGSYRIYIEEFIDNKIVHTAIVQSFNGTIEPVTAECDAVDDCEPDCIPFDKDGALLCICKDDKNNPANSGDYNPQQYKHNQTIQRFNDLDL